ncbi:MAG TPA: hypothetical protein VNA15_07370 [Candidatus Angelobacter sp.]|nr:hypothetical protein [Candidatus Angelobacter sp.]
MPKSVSSSHSGQRLGEIATAQLTLNRISLAGILVCPPEGIVIVPEIDAPRTF